MKATPLLLLLFVPAFIACNSGDPSNAGAQYNNDFETIGYWTEHPGITREASYSGLFSAFTDSTRTYSATLNLKGKDLKNKEIKAISASALVLSRFQDARGKLVLSIEREGKSIVWQGVETNKSMYEADKWAEVKLRVELKEKITDDMIIKLYGLNDGIRKIYWDDFTVQFQ